MSIEQFRPVVSSNGKAKNMDLTTEMKQRLLEREQFSMMVDMALGIRPKMELIIGNGGCVPDSLDLRTLNKNILKRSNIVYPSE